MEELWDMHEKTSQQLAAWEKNISAMCKAGCSSNGQRTPSASRCAELRTLYLWENSLNTVLFLFLIVCTYARLEGIEYPGPSAHRG